jgi:hypothetical protein
MFIPFFRFVFHRPVPEAPAGKRFDIRTYAPLLAAEPAVMLFSANFTRLSLFMSSVTAIFTYSDFPTSFIETAAGTCVFSVPRPAKVCVVHFRKPGKPVFRVPVPHRFPYFMQYKPRRGTGHSQLLL